jgi:cytochrome oxidase assembly protein ShyY1
MTGSVSRRGGIAGFGIFTLAMVAVFVGLGIWQLQRRVEKHILIAALDERLAAEPVPLASSSQWGAFTAGADEFRRVRLVAIGLDFASGARVYSSGSALREDVSGPGKWNFVPAQLSSGETVVVNIGFAQDAAQDRPSGGDTPRRFVTRLPVDLSGYIRFPESASLLTPTPNVDQRLWFTRDHLAMAQALGWDQAGKTIAPFYIDLESPALVPGVRPGRLTVHLKDDHLQYAITWFALAGAVVIAFGVWWRGQRRA